jgi:phage portal protein BeeE
MNIFGFSISRTSRQQEEKTLNAVDNRGSGWWPLIREPFSGAWQRNKEISLDDVLSYAPAFSCITLIASDISKMRLRLVAKDSHGIWNEAETAAYTPVLRKPNQFQNSLKAG